MKRINIILRCCSEVGNMCHNGLKPGASRAMSLSGGHKKIHLLAHLGSWQNSVSCGRSFPTGFVWGRSALRACSFHFHDEQPFCQHCSILLEYFEGCRYCLMGEHLPSMYTALGLHPSTPETQFLVEVYMHFLV